MVIHSLLSAIFGLVFAAVVASLRRSSAGGLMWAGLIYGGLIYMVDFQVLARFVHQFSAFRATNQPLELAVHLVFGAVLAALLTSWSARSGADGNTKFEPLTPAGRDWVRRLAEGARLIGGSL